jgi:hypothetical protein
MCWPEQLAIEDQQMAIEGCHCLLANQHQNVHFHQSCLSALAALGGADSVHLVLGYFGQLVWGSAAVVAPSHELAVDVVAMSSFLVSSQPAGLPVD